MLPCRPSWSGCGPAGRAVHPRAAHLLRSLGARLQAGLDLAPSSTQLVSSHHIWPRAARPGNSSAVGSTLQAWLAGSRTHDNQQADCCTVVSGTTIVGRARGGIQLHGTKRSAEC